LLKRLSSGSKRRPRRARLKTPRSVSPHWSVPLKALPPAYDCGKKWATDASFADIRVLWLCYLETDNARDDRDRYELFAFLQNHKPVFRDTPYSEFVAKIGYDGRPNPNDFAAEFFRAINDFAKEAKDRGVAF
jgi:hypothetical protein